MGGESNPAYDNTFVRIRLAWTLSARSVLTAQVFDNDFPALLPGPLPILPADAQTATPGISQIFASEPVRGRCKVICFHPRHDVTLAMMDPGEIEAVIEGWKGVYRTEGEFLEDTKKGDEQGYVQIFEVSPGCMQSSRGRRLTSG
jgi:UDPglucose--hexose-1-phosphate uridylyltransferase